MIKDRLTDPEAGKGELLLAGGEPPPIATARDDVADTDAADATDGAAPADPIDTADAAPSEPPDAAADEPDDQDRPPPIWMADLARASAEAKAGAAAAEAARPLHADPGPTEVSLTFDELSIASGVTKEQLRSLEQYGLLTGRSLGDDVFYDGDALLVASKAAGFLARGVEARHLRMFKVAAEREAGFLEQLTMPLLKQRNPQARRDAVDLVEELSSLGHDLRTALLRSNLRRHLDQG
ncbi:MAG: hypothetical protein R2702_02100 [Acidimicrobiales bacterium]